MARGRHEVEAYGGIMNEHQNYPDATTTSVLFGQVRRASASHKVDTNHGLLRNRHFTGQHTVLYLGDLATALLGHLQNAETPTVKETPGFNEQRWSLTTQNGDLHVTITSRPYWGFGLLTAGYLNVIHLQGPKALRNRLVLDVASSLGQRPWEWSRPSRASRFLHRHFPEHDLKSNEIEWQGLADGGRDDLNEAIHGYQTRWEDLRQRADNEEDEALNLAIEDDLHVARKALLEDHTTAVERALARVEGNLILLNPSTNPSSFEPHKTMLSTGNTPPSTNDEVTFVDYAALLEEA